MLSTAVLTPPQQLAGMGQIVVVSGQELARAVLGSCVGVAIYDSQAKTGALAHVVLPESNGRPGSPGKFADTAILWMLEALQARGAIRRRLVAKLAGGSQMFAAQGPFSIGEQNIEAARRQLKQAKISLAAEHVAGASGRRITLDCAAGSLIIEVAGKAAVEI